MPSDLGQTGAPPVDRIWAADALFDNMPDAVIVVDEGGVIRDVNAQVASTFGYDKEDLVGQPVEMLMPERFRPSHHHHRAAYAAAPRILMMGEGRGLHGQRKGGDEFPIDIMLSPLPSAAGGALTCAVIRDATERRRVETSLRAQKLQLDTAVNNMTHGLSMFDADARLVLWNERYCEMSGLPAGIIKAGITHLELMRCRKEAGIFSGDPESHSRKVRANVAAGETWNQVLALPDGRTIRSRHRPMPDGSWVAIHEDITERLAVEEMLRQQKLQLDTAVDNMNQGLVMFDADARVVLWNQRYIDMQGLPDNAIQKGMSHLELLRHRHASGAFTGDPEAHSRDMIARVAAGVPWTRVFEFPDGRSIQMVQRPLIGGGWVSTHEDITERLAAEQMLRQQKLQLDTAIDNMNQGLVMFDADARVVLWNQRYIDMYGVSPDFMKVGCSHLELVEHRKALGVFEGNPGAHHRRQLAHVAKGKPWHAVLELADGRSIEIAQRPLSDGGWVSTHEDITERRRAESELHQQRLLIDTAIDNMAQGLVMFDADAKMVLWNQRYIDMYHMPPGVVCEGRTFLDLMKYRKEAELFNGDVEAFIHRNRERVAAGKPWTTIHELQDGRCIQALQRPMADGGWVSTHEDITERRDALRRIEHLAHHDALTGLANRAAFTQFLSGVLENAVEQENMLAVLCLDLDRLKEVNDVFGHAAGDELLKKVAERVTSAADGAFVARLGGDEFCVVITDAQQPVAAAALAKKLQAAMAEAFDLDGHLVQTNSSIGVAIYPSDGADVAALLGNGDAALYRAKREGRGRVCFFNASMDRQLHDQRALQHELLQAIEADELTLLYQPQARVSGEIVGFEALARWQHPKRGLVGPDIFIPLAEDNGLIIQLGEWVLREACREAASWKRPLQLAVNLSPVQFKHGDLPALVHAVLLDTGLAPHRLELELTEGVFIDDFSRAISILRRLKALGVKIAMDDFGTGYSSLSYLHSVPLDKIKIDRSFIGQMDENPQSTAIIRAVIGLAHGLSLPVLVEGVESHEQLAFLKRESCDEVQGFLIGRPQHIDLYAEIVGKTSSPERLQAV